jgi:hypothetical protein
MNRMFNAILNDDTSAAKLLLESDGSLVTKRFHRPKLFSSKIFHRMYVPGTNRQTDFEYIWSSPRDTIKRAPWYDDHVPSKRYAGFDDQLRGR